MSLPLRTPWPPRPATTMFVTVFMAGSGAGGGGQGRGGRALAVRLFVLLELFGDEDAGPAGNDDGQFAAFQALAQQPVKLVRARPRLDDVDAPHADAVRQVFEHHLVGGLVVEPAPGAR